MVSIGARVTVYTIDIAHASDTTASGKIIIATDATSMGPVVVVLTLHSVDVGVSAGHEEKVLVRTVCVVHNISIIIVLLNVKGAMQIRKEVRIYFKYVVTRQKTQSSNQALKDVHRCRNPTDQNQPKNWADCTHLARARVYVANVEAPNEKNKVINTFQIDTTSTVNGDTWVLS